MSWCDRIISTIWSPMRCTGLSADSGSWKIIAIFLPRTLSSVCLLAADQLDAGDLGRAGDHRLARQQTHRRRGTSPTCRSRSRRRRRRLRRGRRRGRRRAPLAPCRSAVLNRPSGRGNERTGSGTVVTFRCPAWDRGVSQTVADEVDAHASSTSEPHGKTTSHQSPRPTASCDSWIRLPSDVLPWPGLRAEAEERQRRLGDDRPDDRSVERDEDRTDRVRHQVRTTIRRFDAPDGARRPR